MLWLTRKKNNSWVLYMPLHEGIVTKSKAVNYLNSNRKISFRFCVVSGVESFFAF